MPQRISILVLTVMAAGLMSAACSGDDHASQPKVSRPCDAIGVKDVVARFGKSLQRVSLLAPRPILEKSIQKVYEPFVTPQLLESWLKHPAEAPGRRVSSPWPARIEIDSIQSTGERACLVRGEIVYLTSVEVAHGGVAAKTPVTLRVHKDSRWRISAYSSTPASGT